MPKADGAAQQPFLAQGVPVAQPVAASPAPQVPASVLQAAHEMQTGTGIISMDVNSSMPVMNMPQPGALSLQQPGMVGAHVVAVPATPGIAVLAQVQGLCLRQNIRVAELLLGFEQKNRFKIMVKPPTLDPSQPLSDEISQQLPPLFFAIEDSDCLARQCCRQNRSFTMHVLDATNQPVLELERPFTCTAKCTGVCMCPCPPNSLIVKLPSGQLLGQIIETNPLCNCDHWFQIVDSFGTVLYTINIPLCECWAAPRPTCCCPLWQAEVRRGEGDGGTVATLQNIFAGCNVRGLCTKADNFQVNYLDQGLSVDHKALMLCSMFLIDMVYFERRGEGGGGS